MLQRYKREAAILSCQKYAEVAMRQNQGANLNISSVNIFFGREDKILFDAF